MVLLAGSGGGRRRSGRVSTVDENPRKRDWPKEWRKKGLLHRTFDRPAVIYPSGRKEYWRNGMRWRKKDLPAVVDSDGEQEWYVDGLLGRAAVDADGAALEAAEHAAYLARLKPDPYENLPFGFPRGRVIPWWQQSKLHRMN